MSGPLAVIATLFVAASGFWLLSRRHYRRFGPENLWENEDIMSREGDGTWAEGSTISSTNPAPNDLWGGRAAK